MRPDVSRQRSQRERATEARLGELHLESSRQEGTPIPEIHTTSEWVEVEA